MADTLEAPRLLSVVRLSATHSLLTWENKASYTWVYVWRRALPSGTWAQVNKVPVSSSRYDYGLVSATGYEYRLVGLKGSVLSGPSNEVSVGAWQDQPVSPDTVVGEVLADGRVRVTWKNKATTAAPYRWLYVFRSIDGAAYKQINRLTMPAVGDLPEAYVDAPGPNRKVAYRLWAANDAGGAYYHGPVSAAVYTIPAAPTGVAGAWTAGGIRVAWADTAAHTNLHDVEHLVEGGAWTAQAQVSGSAWLMSTPGASTARRKFRVRAVLGALVSAWVESGWLPGAVAPLAPVPATGLPQDVLQPVTVAWRHAPVDGSEQTQWAVRHRLVGAGTWSASVTGSGPVQSATITLTGYSNGQNVEWQVQTRGALTAGFSPWSATAVLQLRPAPQVTITSPPAGNWASEDLRIDWTATGETGWAVQVLDATTGAELAYRTGARKHGGALLLPRLLADGQKATVLVSATTSTGRATSGAVTVTTVLARPAKPVPSVIVDTDQAQVRLTAVPGAGAGLPATVAIEWLRSDDGGDSWEELGPQDPVAGYLIDFAPPTCREVLYRARAVSGVPSSQLADPVAVTVRSRDTWLHWGDSWAESARGGKIGITGDAGREVSMHQFLGRDRLVFFRGRRRPRSRRVQVLLARAGSSDMSRWAEAADHDGLCLLRDASGRRIVGQVTDLSWSQDAPMVQTVDFTFIEQ